MSEVRAKLSRLPVSGFKVRLLADQIRGKYVSDALDILSFSKKASSKNLKKLLESAIANAEHNKGLDVDNLFISEISVDEAFLLKRIKPRARGRADRIQKRSCHINLALNTKEI
ncbi:MAG: 50S ribosomal protein L22 [Pseudomonadota bacterium]|jgi:large subunit ribosomal protein L22|nr:50S ribosomal protein L22 [Pseudomonadota bacterium]MEC7786841.1 50S ribosomal protein L22 [Pseudomonadota bacterium]MEC8146767.1 50S ribosomal protein L22 [Pseudomonadota bacterium]MEC8378531.1 50S ribosomal protein L22 [Pseudomonadota bacterium]MEC9193678.1 50S ribosomal protein L22 [Pseudomonadota bacterium]|tara:strand:- start:594 stop:935 length:342 start_codon:yes stop_codon:yes gene_type:complete